VRSPLEVSRVASGLLCLHAIAFTPAGPMELIRSSISIVSGLPCEKVRSAPAIVFSGYAQRSLTLWPARSPSRLATLYTEGSDSFVTSAAASIATGWSEPVPGRELHPLKSSAFSRRTFSTTERLRYTPKPDDYWLCAWGLRDSDMPNGGSDCCGTCWFNAKNKGAAGYAHASDAETDYCTIRELPIDDPFYTYCGNHPHRRPDRDTVPIGPVFIDKGNGRRLWKPSPDTEEVRLHLLDLLGKIDQGSR
jgi:hypothetical protein